MAAARCNYKIAKKRLAAATKTYEAMVDAIAYISDRLEKAKKYRDDSLRAVERARSKVSDLEQRF